MWQIASLLLCSVNVFNTLLSGRNGHTLPFLQLAIAYTILLLVHIWRYETTQISWPKYILVSVFACAGDICAIYAYNTTSLSSAMLLSTTVVFWVAPISVFIQKRKVSIVQAIAIFVGFGGAIVLFVADGTGDMKWLGNVLALVAAISYAISNVLQELLVQTGSVTVFLCRFSMFSAPVTMILGGAIEWRGIRDYDWQPVVFGFIFAYSILLAVYYSFIPLVLQYSTAIEMNLSLLSSNFFSLLISVLAFHQKADWLYFLGFLCVPLAIVLYTVCPPRERTAEESSSQLPAQMLENILPKVTEGDTISN
jgi:drug/metabolite transporter (DMT)-like permease